MAAQMSHCIPLLVMTCQILSASHPASAESPDLQWTPQPLVIANDAAARYIDFESGDDRNPGTRAAPWKHHPWDPEARSVAHRDDATHTYYFKQGVIYRGHLTARRSGTASRPIVLTVASDWGNGAARISGARAMEGGWQLCSADASRDLPQTSLGKTWCIDTTLDGMPQALWAESGTGTLKAVPARQPNWTITNPDDPRSNWAALSDVRMRIRVYTDATRGFAPGDSLQIGSAKGLQPCDCRVLAIGRDYLDIDSPEQRIKGLRDGAVIGNGRVTTTAQKIWGTQEIVRKLTDHALAENGPHDGATIWVEHSYMPKPMADIVTATDTLQQGIEVNLHLAPEYGPKPFNRYYLEGLVRYLDAPGEFAIVDLGRNRARILLRLPDDSDPNQWRIELPQQPVLVDISDREHIRIAGLEFAHARQIAAGTDDARFAALHAAAIEIRGSSTGITVDHNRLRQLPAGIIASPHATKRSAQTLDWLMIADNDFMDIEGSPIALSNGWSHAGLQKTGSRLVHASITRNRIQDCGYRTLSHWSVGAHGHGIEVTGGEIIDISYNHIQGCWGSGIAILLGSDYDRGQVERPLLRGLVHHNKVVDSVLGLQDYGGIASWMGGPLYMYNNISGNAVGYRYAEERRIPNLDPFRGSSFATAFYFDGQYKGYFFNNIGWGRHNDIQSSIYNAVGFKEALGFNNAVFNNTLSNVAVGLHKDMPQHGRSYYLGNLFTDIGHNHIQHESKVESIEYPTLAYANNVFHGDVDDFGQLGAGRRNIFKTLADWISNLSAHNALLADTGIETAGNPLTAAQELDFRLHSQSAAIDRGVKFFVPWSLSRVVGEWNFYASTSFPDTVTDESINMNSEWEHRSMFSQIPRRDLHCANTRHTDYTTGTLEDWIPGALSFDGRTRTCSIDNGSARAPYAWKGAKGAGRTEAAQRESLDIDSGNLTIEAVIRPDRTGRQTGLMGKLDNAGYALHITSDGMLHATLNHGDASGVRQGNTILTDNNWHHILVEFDREQPDGIHIYVDGRLDDGAWSGTMSKRSVSNARDFEIGRVGDQFYAGGIDFVRIAKSTLKESETSIDELYKWEFDGPFLRDITGSKPTGSRRDAGAVEAQPGTVAR